MKFLLVTGNLARDVVRYYAERSRADFEVEVLPVAVAALLHPAYVASELKKRLKQKFDMILVPGLMGGDVSLIEEATGIPTFKGTRYAADLPLLFSSMGKIRLSKSVAADQMLREELRAKSLEEIEGAERRRSELVKKGGNICVGDLAIGPNFPPRVMAEIVDAAELTDGEIVERARYYRDEGADIIDIGMIAGSPRPADASRCVRTAIGASGLVVSIDTFDPAEAEAGVKAGAKIVVSGDAGNLEDLARFAREIAVVVLPTNLKKAFVPKDVDERVRLLEENIRLARNLGIHKLIADPILDSPISPGIAKSISAYHLFRSRNPEVPMMMGVANVTELMDADTIGVNALLAGFAVEVGASVLLTTEVSDKARGSVRELKRACRMMFVAKRRNAAPKDLGLDALLIKDGKVREEFLDPNQFAGVRSVDLKGEPYSRQNDPKGCFRILLDRRARKILLVYYSGYEMGRADLIIRGDRAEEIYRHAIKLGLVSLLDHAAYLGDELRKAETALVTGKSYVQDRPLFECLD